MNYYAQPRMTRDIDLAVSLTAADAETIVRLFEPDPFGNARSLSKLLEFFC